MSRLMLQGLQREWVRERRTCDTWVTCAISGRDRLSIHETQVSVKIEFVCVCTSAQARSESPRPQNLSSELDVLCTQASGISGSVTHRP